MHKTSERPWLKNYQKNVPYEINPDKYPNLLALMDESFAKYSNSYAHKCLGKILTFREWDVFSKKIAVYLNSLNLSKGEKVAVMLPNLLQNPISIVGILRAGLVVVNVNPLYSERELAHQLKDSDAKAIIILENFSKSFNNIVQKTNVKHVITTNVGDLLGFKGLLINFTLRYLKKTIPKIKYNKSITTLYTFKQINKNIDSDKYKLPKIKCNDIAFLQYTGGTTGLSKGAVLTHRNLVANCIQAEVWLMPAMNNLKTTSKNNGTIVCALPLYHIFALTACMFLGMRANITNLLIPNPRNLNGFIKELKGEKFHIFPGVNTLFNALMNHKKFKDLDFSNLKISIGGGMSMTKVVADKWHKITNCPMIEGYGLSETSPVATVVPVNTKSFIGNVGLPVSSTNVAIIDNNETELNYGELGEIVISGPQVMDSYWNNKIETDKAFTSKGYLKTGDLGVMDENGYVSVTDRKKDMILVSGFNVYPNEIEEIVSTHPDVQECAVIGVPSESTGEMVKLFVISRDKKASIDSIKSLCRKNLAAYKCPKEIVYIDELPKSNVGKILKRELK